MGTKPPQRTEVLGTHTVALFAAAVRRAVELLRAGEVVALPTETVYGLAANALDARAVGRIFEIKGRPAHNPIIVHVASLELARRCVAAWPALAEKLAKSFWPGPLTLVLPRAGQIPDVVTAGGSTVGVRWPSHPFIQAVIRECGFPLAAPSANPSSRLSPTSADHVRQHLGGKIRLIVDGGRSQIGIESTVLDLSTSPPRLLRPGMIHEQALLALTGELKIVAADVSRRTCRSGKKSAPTDLGGCAILNPPSPTPVLKSPGLLRKHYSPRARLVLLSWRDETHLKAQTAQFRVHGSKTCIIAHTRIPSGKGYGRVSVIPRDPVAFARAIYAELHQCDEAGADLIVVEALPETGEWRALADRLKRAAAS